MRGSRRARARHPLGRVGRGREVSRILPGPLLHCPSGAGPAGLGCRVQPRRGRPFGQNRQRPGGSGLPGTVRGIHGHPRAPRTQRLGALVAELGEHPRAGSGGHRPDAPRRPRSGPGDSPGRRRRPTGCGRRRSTPPRQGARPTELRQGAACRPLVGSGPRSHPRPGHPPRGTHQACLPGAGTAGRRAGWGSRPHPGRPTGSDR